LAKRFSGKRMRELRRERYPRIEAWAVALDRGWRAVQYYETDFRAPPMGIIERAADLLEVDPTDFFVEQNGRPRRRKRPQCVVDGCERSAHARRRCSRHYRALRQQEAAKR
jgi:hypothetical protein